MEGPIGHGELPQKCGNNKGFTVYGAGPGGAPAKGGVYREKFLKVFVCCRTSREKTVKGLLES